MSETGLRVLVIRKGACWVRKAREAVVIGSYAVFHVEMSPWEAIALAYAFAESSHQTPTAVWRDVCSPFALNWATAPGRASARRAGAREPFIGRAR